MGEGARRPHLRGAHVQRRSRGPPRDHRPPEHHSVCAPLATSTGLETEAQKSQVTGAGSLSEAARRSTTPPPPPAREFAQGPGLDPAPIEALRESQGAGGLAEGGLRFPGAFQGRGQELGCPGAGRSGGGPGVCVCCTVSVTL